MAVFSNRATLSYNGITTNSNVVTGEIVEVLTVNKEAVTASYTAGDTLTYVVSIVNGGAVPYSALTLSDNLGAYTFGTQTLVPLSYVDGSLRYYVNGTLSATPAIEAGPYLTVSGINVPAGGNAMLIYSATANEYAPLSEGASIVNVATVSGGGITPITATETVEVTNGVRLSVNKALAPLTVTENGEITYTFTISNFGNTATVATDDVILRDNFDPILSNITVTLNGETLSEGIDYTYDEGSGAFATAVGRISVPAATFSQSPDGTVSVTPGVAVLTVSGTV